MKKIVLLSVAGILLAASCTKDDAALFGNADQNSRPYESSLMSSHQAELYASMFSSLLARNETPENETRSGDVAVKEIDNIDYLVENGDTLLYAFNYKNNEGYILIRGDYSMFPIVSHARTGNVCFNKLDITSPFYDYVMLLKETVKENIRNNETMESDYYDNWKDLGKEGYEYEIEIGGEPVPDTRGRREQSSKKASIYPYTGEDLVYWCQDGGYNYYAPNKVSIGCPAIAIGMLLYDTSCRLYGNNTPTVPEFDLSDRYDISNMNVGTALAQKLRQIADNIPNYIWGFNGTKESGAQGSDIFKGLRNLGYKKASRVPYDFEQLYENLSFDGIDYFGNEVKYNRGIIIGGYNTNGNAHVWFCDGYYEQVYTCKKKFLGITIKTWYEYDDRLYMNWGWGYNGGNGWFCATDGYWTTIEEGRDPVYYKRDAEMYINLSYYEKPS